MPVEVLKCYICPSNTFIDDHHLDCCEGKLSPETVPLCRRCHKTYHIWGVEWFDDEYLDKAIEIENRRREIHYANLKSPTLPLQLLKREDIKRSDYWYKKHGIKREHPIKAREAVPLFPIKLPYGEPLCGWQWVNEHLYDLKDWVPRIEIISPNLKFSMDIDNTVKLKDAVKILRGVKRGPH